MKRILLASASIVAFAGVAAAQETDPTGIIFGGDAALGFNDNFNDEEETGFFYEANLSVTFRSILSNGLVAESTFTIPVADTNLGNGSLGVDDDFVLGLSLEGMGGLFLGDVAFGGEEFSFATMQSADFSEQDGETVLRGETTLGGFTVAASALILDGDGDEPGSNAIVDTDGVDLIPDTADDIGDDDQDFIDQLSIGGNGNIGNLALSFGYQDESDIIGSYEDDPTTPVDESEEDYETVEGIFDTDNGDFNPDEQFGIAAGLAVAGADLKVGYGRNLSAETTSYGVQISYPIGPVTAKAEYVFEPDFDDNSYSVGVEYESGNIILKAEYGEEVGEEEYDIKVGYSFSDVTTVQAGYNDDDGGFVAYRQGLGQGAFVEASYAEAEDSGFGSNDFVDDIREGTTLKVGLEF